MHYSPSTAYNYVHNCPQPYCRSPGINTHSPVVKDDSTLGQAGSQQHSDARFHHQPAPTRQIELVSQLISQIPPPASTLGLPRNHVDQLSRPETVQTPIMPRKEDAPQTEPYRAGESAQVRNGDTY